MGRQGLVWTILALWVVLAAASVLAPMLTASSDFGMTRGLNRLAMFLQLQLLAIILAALCFFMARQVKPGWPRWLARGPLLLELALGLVIVGAVVWSNLQKPDPGAPAPDRPVTAPADTPTPKPEG
ncbi:hypothetical protein [Frigidibacter sp. ROC022]|uniref:hypothetical protein n=1 Tax=Frigidibacter sp. ROC022 TaxID=2971796 RepID=UPI00215ACBE2|nr:hypothetical protein [Frigidibacter sp. ROC022]MCR8725151.1 hypothetical protein [Frigidibacter sp. ROC022]